MICIGILKILLFFNKNTVYFLKVKWAAFIMAVLNWNTMDSAADNDFMSFK